MRLVLIHGRSQQGKDPLKLQQEWLAALRKGLAKAGQNVPADLSVSFPFFGDTLDKMVKAMEAPLINEVRTRGNAAPGAEAEEAAFRAEIMMEMAARQKVTQKAIEASFRGTPQERGPLNWGWVHALLKALDNTPLGAREIDRFTRDVWVYLTNVGVRAAIDALVAAELKSGPCVVVAHSLGSIVAYNVLCQSDPSIDVRQFITVGSPLGIKAVKAKLDSPLRMPKCCKAWFNARDPRDVVALYPLDAKNFGITPSIRNKGNVDNFTSNRHGIAGYLSDVDVADAIHDALQ